MPRLTTRRAHALLGLMVLIYVLLYGSVVLSMHAAFVQSADDLSNVDQVVWNSQHGRILERTTGTRSLPRYGEHLEPIWIALGLLYHVWDDVDALLLAQTIALALGAFPVFWLARAVWGEARQKRSGGERSRGSEWERDDGARGAGRQGDAKKPSASFVSSAVDRRAAPIANSDSLAGLVFAAAYLLSPFVGRVNVADVHALPFAVAPLLLAVYWVWRGQWRRLVPLLGLLLLVREDAGLLVIALGVWALVARRARHGLALVLAGATGVLVAVFGIIAHFADARYGGDRSNSIFFERYAQFGEGPAGVLVGMLTRPDLWAALLGTPERIAFGRDFFLSSGGLLPFAPAAWLLFLPHLALNMLSDYRWQAGGYQHYSAPLVPGLMVATIFGGARLLRWGRGHPALRVALLLVVLAGTVAAARGAAEQPLARAWILPPVTPHHHLLPKMVAPIPPRAPLAADPQLHPYLAHRPDAYRFPEVGDNAEWVLVDVVTNRTQPPTDLRRDVLALLEEGWGVDGAQDGFLRLRRGGTNRTLPPTFFSFTLAQGAPQVLLAGRVGNLEVVGYDTGQDFWGRVWVAWHLRPQALLPPDFALDTALLGLDGEPLPDTSGQPNALLAWLPVPQWQPGQTYLLRTLPRDVGTPFVPALRARGEIADCQSSIITCERNGWVTGGEWRLVDGHVRRGTEGWRQWEPPAPLARGPGAWSVARLGAWRVEEEGKTVLVTLHWQAAGDSALSTQRFLHLVPAAGPPVPLAQADGPLGGVHPVERWQAGEWVTETVTLTVPSGLPAGYRLLVGLYDPTTGQRLPATPDAGDATFELERENR